MPNPNENIEDLLSGMLDGILTEADSAVLRAEMDRDPAVKASLTQITHIGESLRLGRSSEGLGKDFANQIIAATQKRATEMVGDTPVWVSSLMSLPEIHASTYLSVHQRRMLFLAGTLALAATVLVALLSIPMSNRLEIVSLPKVLDSTGEKPVVDNSLIKPEGNTASENQRESSSAVASQPVSPMPSNLSETDGKLSVLQPGESEIANVSPLAEAAANTAAIARETVKQSTSKLAQSEEAALKLPNLFFTTVMDVSIDPLAVENRILEKILESHRIVYTDDLAVSESQLKILEDSKLVGNVANTEEKMGVMFLRSSAGQLDLAMRDIINRFEDFPEFALDVTTDPSTTLLIEQLSSIRVADGSNGFATRLSKQNAGISKRDSSFSPFTASARRAKPMANASRERYSGGLVPSNPDREEMSNVLLLLRPKAK